MRSVVEDLSAMAMPPPKPRRFPWGRMGAGPKFALLFGGIWTFVGTLISTVFTIAGGPVWDDTLLDRRGVATQAELISVEQTNTSVNRRRVFRLHFSFTDEDGATHTGSVGTTDGRMISQATPGASLPIQYDPHAATRVRVAGARASLFGWFVLFPLAFAVVGLTVAGEGLRQALRVRSIYVHGDAARAEVIAVRRTGMRVNQRRVMRVDYAFDTITGRVTGRGSSFEPPPVGGRVWVLYDPSAPGRNVLA
jgi:hypothetical protein